MDAAVVPEKLRTLGWRLSGVSEACALQCLGAMREGLDRLEERTKQFAIAIITLCARLERLRGLQNVATQLSRAGGSVASNHRAMRRSRSMKEFAAKLQIVCEESDECVLWLEVAAGTDTGLPAELPAVLKEARELRNIFAKARATTRNKM